MVLSSVPFPEGVLEADQVKDLAAPRSRSDRRHRRHRSPACTLAGGSAYLYILARTGGKPDPESGPPIGIIAYESMMLFALSARPSCDGAVRDAPALVAGQGLRSAHLRGPDRHRRPLRATRIPPAPPSSSAATGAVDVRRDAEGFRVRRRDPTEPNPAARSSQRIPSLPGKGQKSRTATRLLSPLSLPSEGGDRPLAARGRSAPAPRDPDDRRMRQPDVPAAELHAAGHAARCAADGRRAGQRGQSAPRMRSPVVSPAYGDSRYGGRP